MPRKIRRALGFSAIAAAGYALWRAAEARREESDVRWVPQPFPAPPIPVPREPGNENGGRDA